MNVRVKQRITPKHNNQQSTLSARCKLAVNQWLGYLQPPLSSFFSFFFSYQACPNAPLLSAGKEDSDGRSTATSESTEATEEGEEQPSLADGLTSFQKLVFVKAFREEKVRIGIFSHVFRKFVFYFDLFCTAKVMFCSVANRKANNCSCGWSGLSGLLQRLFHKNGKPVIQSENTL